MVYFVGAGPGASDLITVRGMKLLGLADIVIYAGSLVNPELLEFCKKGCQIYDSSTMVLEEVIDVMRESERKNMMTVRLHTGDPSIFGAVREQMDELDRLGISYESCPGVSSFCGAAASLNMEYTLPGISQKVTLERIAGRTPVPEGVTRIFFLSASHADKLVESLLEEGVPKNMPTAVVYKATWPDEKTIVCTLEELPCAMKNAGIDKTGLIIVGQVIACRDFTRSCLYDSSFSTGFRKAAR